jgi:class 3 adenylate cyclase
LLDRPTVLRAVAVLLLAVLATNIADQLGVIPYAPLYAQAPFAAGTLARPWLFFIGIPTFAILLVQGALIVEIVDGWRERERRLAETSEQLGHANDLISRYVAAQVAKHIIDGDYEAIHRHSRRRLTVFFSDVVGFTQLADTMEPEDLSRILNEYLSEMTAIAEHYGATIDKFIGDAVMAFFGAPGTTDDRLDALNGVRMAIAMLRRLADLRAKWAQEGFDEAWNIRIGINTGQASVGNFGSQRRLDYTAIGRQVNLAARLQTAAEPGTILISHATWLLAQNDIACVPKGEIQVKGFAQPIRVYAADATGAEAVTPVATAG